ncbi:hypothetical protein [Collimonas humicola]|uniref:hypothetical protein n=1 Tax=Collimonas humicola TaxID=2825886 RepID=UPI001B8AB972|nr:hypothetical protein [Collimonas humicola]
MKIPNKGTSKYVICELIYLNTSLTADQLKSFIEAFTKKTVETSIESMLDECTIVRVGEQLLNCDSIRRHFNALHTKAKPVDPSAIAPSRTPPVFRPLQSKYMPSLDGRREGSGEFRKIKSRHV